MTEAQEVEYANMIGKLLESNKLTEITTIEYLKSVMLGYLKTSQIKYSFVYLPKFDEAEGLDPYADNGDVAPGEEPPFDFARAGESNIDQEIEDAENANMPQKVKLLKKIRQLKELKTHAKRVSEEETFDMMIQNTYKEIQNIEDNEAEGEYDEEGEGDIAFYEGEEEQDINSQKYRSQSLLP